MLDSKNIFIASEHLHRKVQWLPDYLTAWMYSGVREDFNYELVFTNIREFFPKGSLYMVRTRHNSTTILLGELEQTIQTEIGTSFLIWDSHWKRVVEFNPIGVFRRGFIPE